MAEEGTNFVKGFLLSLVGAGVAWLGLSFRSQDCGFFGTTILCELGGFLELVSAAVILTGAVYAAVSLFDFFKNRSSG